jgi:hypothetical protein
MKLYALEQTQAGPERQDKIEQTRFGVRQVGNGYEFFVIEQTHR